MNMHTEPFAAVVKTTAQTVGHDPTAHITSWMQYHHSIITEHYKFVNFIHNKRISHKLT